MALNKIGVLAGTDQAFSGRDLLNVKIDNSQLLKLAVTFPTAAPRIISRSANKTGVYTRKIMVQRLTKEVINVKSGDLKRRNVMLKKGTRADPGATVTVMGSRIPLIQFKGTSQSKQGVGYRTTPGGARMRIREAFISTMGGASRPGVYARRGKERLPIHELYGPSVPKALETHAGTLHGVGALSQKRFYKEINSQIQYELSRK